MGKSRTRSVGSVQQTCTRAHVARTPRRLFPITNDTGLSLDAGQRRTRPAPPPPLPLRVLLRLDLAQHDAVARLVRRGLGGVQDAFGARGAEALGHAVHPALVVVGAEPVRAADGDHEAAELAGPALAFGLGGGEGVVGLALLVDRGGEVGVGVVGGGDGDVLAEHHAGPREHDEAEVGANGPQGDDDADAVDALAAEDHVARSHAGGSVAWLACDDGVLAGPGADGARLGCRHDFDAGDVVFGAGEAGRVVDGACTGALDAGILPCLMLEENEEPRHGEGGCICGVDDRVENVEPCECHAMKRRLCFDVWREEDGERKGSDRVDIHRQLKG